MPSELILDVDRAALSSVPHIDQFCGPWAIMPSHLQMMAQMIQSLDLKSHLQNVADGKNEHLMAGSGDGYYSDYMVVNDGVAIASARGTLMKQRASMSRNTSTVALRRSVRTAANDATIRGIMIRVDSPGGTVAGTKDLATEIAAAAEKKPTHVYVEDLGASAAYWISSQAAHVSAGSTALVGSIGTYSIVDDYSKWFEDHGVKVHVVRAGEFKGSGVLGTEVTDKQLAEMQRVIDGLNDHFVEGVASGRGLSKSTVKGLNDGRVHIADAALDLKLIDAVESFDEAYERLDQETNAKRSVRMSTKAPNKAAETSEDPKADQPAEDPKASDKTETPASDTPPKTFSQRDELKRFMNAFGESAGAKYFSESMSYTDACEAHIIQLSEDVKSANERADAAEKKLAQLSLGEEEAVDTGAPPKGEKQAGTGWQSLFKQRGT